MNRFLLMLRHRWHDHRHTLRVVPDDMAERLEQQIALSETRHTGEVRVVVEAALPLSYLWRVGPNLTLQQAIRQRALSWFGRLRVWDTEHNNGVMIYLLLAEHHIEVVADRGVSRHVPPSHWQAVVAHLSAQLKAGAFEQGLGGAMAEVSALLETHFPEPTDPVERGRGPNQLSNAIVRA
jgi:uncharacterized membrane protein